MWKWLSSTKKQATNSGLSKPKKNPSTNSSLEFSVRTFYVVFCDAEHIIAKFLKKGFAHCYVIEKLEHVYMMFDPTRNGLNVSMPCCTSDHPLIENMLILDPSINIVEVFIQIKSEALVLKPKPLTCVTALEYILGVSFGMLGAVTPYRLYKALLRAKHPNIVGARKLCLQVDQQQNGQKPPPTRPLHKIERFGWPPSNVWRESAKGRNTYSSDN